MKSIIRIKLQGIPIFMFMTNGLPAGEENRFQILIEKKKKVAWEVGNSDSDTDFHSLGQVT